MGKALTVGALVVVAAFATQASAAFLFFENFEGGGSGTTVNGWTHWVQRKNVDASGVASEPPALGDIQPQSGANATEVKTGGSNWNGGYFKTISGLPTNTPLTIDGYWRHATGGSSAAQNHEYFEVRVLEGTYTNTTADITGGTLAWKHDFQSGRLTPFSNGSAAGPHLISQFFTAFSTDTDGVFSTPSGTVTIVLKSGNSTGSTQLFAEWDDIHITPEPATMGLLALGVVPMLRRRRA